MSRQKLNRHAIILAVTIIITLLLSLLPYTIKFERSTVVSQEIPVVILETMTASVSAYTSRAAETDDTPFYTANGEHVYDGGAACPSRYKFGTTLRINGKLYTCNDRMNKRYRQGNYFDIWMAEYGDAIEHGRRSLTVEIIQK